MQEFSASFLNSPLKSHNAPVNTRFNPLQTLGSSSTNKTLWLIIYFLPLVILAEFVQPEWFFNADQLGVNFLIFL